MTKEKILHKFQSILSSIKHRDIVFTEDTNKKIAEEFELDSLEFMQFIAALETKFSIEFDVDATYEELNDVEYLVKEIDRKTNKVVSEKVDH